MAAVRIFGDQASQPMTETVHYSISGPRRKYWPRFRWLRTAVFCTAIFLWSIPFGVVIVTYFQIRRVPSEVRWALRLWSTGFVWAARNITRVRYRLEGLEKIPNQPVIFVGNHQSYWESIAFTSFFPDINVITWSRVMDIPVFGWGLREAPMIPVHRDQPGANLRRIVRDARANLAQGRSILFFPEGHRVRPGLTLPYQRGLGVMYSATDAWIVPVVNNAALSWKDGFKVKPGGEITIRFLDPIPPGAAPSHIAKELEILLNTEKDRLPGVLVA